MQDKREMAESRKFGEMKERRRLFVRSRVTRVRAFVEPFCDLRRTLQSRLSISPNAILSLFREDTAPFCILLFSLKFQSRECITVIYLKPVLSNQISPLVSALTWAAKNHERSLYTYNNTIFFIFYNPFSLHMVSYVQDV